MASEYLKWKYKDVRPEEKQELTEAERRKNWWHYHKLHVAVVLVLLGAAGSILWNALTRVRPDYQIAYVGQHRLPDGAAAALEAGFAALGEDLNGDGRVAAVLVQYAAGGGTDAGAAAASAVSLMGDVLECESYFFLLEDPAAFQETYHVLRRLDGSLPEEGDRSAGETCLLWSRCPVLAGMELGTYAYSLPGEEVSGDSQELLSGLWFARRGFWTEKSTPHQEGCEALWNILTEGAVS